MPFDADHDGVAFAVVVVDVDGGDVLLGLHEEVDGFGAGFGSDDGLVKSVGRRRRGR